MRVIPPDTALQRSRRSRLRIRLNFLMIGGMAAAASVATVRFEMFERFHLWAAPYEHLEFDEFIPVLMIWCLAGIVLAVMRGLELKAEVRIGEESERQASALARFDTLTGLPNRRLFIEHIDAARDRGHAGKSLAVLLIDLDRFKPVNDLHGHDAGDCVLIEIARRFSTLTASHGSTLVARIGGDEFACVIEYDQVADDPLLLAKSIINRARSPIATSNAMVIVGASVGIAVEGSTAVATAELLRMADRAMYQAKASGRNQVRLFDEAMDAGVRAASKLEAELRSGLRAGQMAPHYQPIVQLSDGGLSGFEALARWDHPAQGLLEARHFIGAAESSEQIDALSLALLDRACADARAWPADLALSFNISPIQLRNAWLPEEILRTLTRHGIAPGRLIIELTESGLFNDIDVARAMIISLKNAGVRFAMDDFGTGYSSLSHLSQLPFDIIKIDRSFIEGVDIHAHDSIVTAIIRMGHSLGMAITAEGVTSACNVQSLNALGCDYGQGYLLGRPQDAAKALEWIARSRAAPVRPSAARAFSPLPGRRRTKRARCQ